MPEADNARMLNLPVRIGSFFFVLEIKCPHNMQCKDDKQQLYGFMQYLSKLISNCQVFVIKTCSKEKEISVIPTTVINVVVTSKQCVIGE